MKYLLIIINITIILSFTSCSPCDNSTEKEDNNSNADVKVSYVYQNDAQTKNIKRKGATIVKLATLTLGKALNKAVLEDGAEKAIDFCSHQAMSITDSLATAEGVTIRRLAKKNRNPENETNAVESKIYKQYVMEWLSKRPLEPKITIDNDGHPVYYKPIIINQKCLTCHGKPGETMPENIASKIKELYPNDKAINFEDKHPRGMWAITFNNIKIGE
jgi:uncharacterized lipoprotein YehR (DUF1307 family)